MLELNGSHRQDGTGDHVDLAALQTVDAGVDVHRVRAEDDE